MLNWFLFLLAALIVPAIAAWIGVLIEKHSTTDDFPCFYFVLTSIFLTITFIAGLIILLTA